jgi:hypothetical protein
MPELTKSKKIIIEEEEEENGDEDEGRDEPNYDDLFY